jgi:hypothetical protein
MGKLIVHLKGGLGNQMFTYAFAKNLSMRNNLELVIDPITGFKNDKKYKRKYALHHFNINARYANFWESIPILHKYWRYILIRISQFQALNHKYYIDEDLIGSVDILSVNFKGTLHLEGYWQNHIFFKGVEKIILKEYQFTSLAILKKSNLFHLIKNDLNSVAIHIRFFDNLKGRKSINLTSNYYLKAINFITSKLNAPNFYVFTNNIESSIKLLPKKYIYNFSNSMALEDNDAIDLGLMSLCKNLIISNSTFSWWGGYLCRNRDKYIVAPNLNKNKNFSWKKMGTLPNNWVQI